MEEEVEEEVEEEEEEEVEEEEVEEEEEEEEDEEQDDNEEEEDEEEGEEEEKEEEEGSRGAAADGAAAAEKSGAENGVANGGGGGGGGGGGASTQRHARLRPCMTRSDDMRDRVAVATPALQSNGDVETMGLAPLLSKCAKREDAGKQSNRNLLHPSSKEVQIQEFDPVLCANGTGHLGMSGAQKTA
ncbi:hypothetical protein CBR_g37830 [Chara braunii]|uniref:Uncharacterized protein n=1 Tax=Chara braunii TaxID=69332 RepID=A0A388LNR7_CHABU|nr:hypothetical protein CBR_g37830 [Chara braunii]|eukprot:GBG83958.1 hypothetical protein CBR_g37830 [Chara braunii]